MLPLCLLFSSLFLRCLGRHANVSPTVTATITFRQSAVQQLLLATLFDNTSDDAAAAVAASYDELGVAAGGGGREGMQCGRK